MKGVYVITALVGLAIATWVAILVINGFQSWLRKREEKRDKKDEEFRRWLAGPGRTDEPDGL